MFNIFDRGTESVEQIMEFITNTPKHDTLHMLEMMLHATNIKFYGLAYNIRLYQGIIKRTLRFM